MSYTATTDRARTDVRVRTSFALRRLWLAIEPLLLRRPGVAAAIAFALVLASPCVTTGLVADDVVHRLMLRDDPGIAALARHPLDLFRFASGNPAAVRELVEAGMFPWWADPEVRLAFFRPLASLTHWLDHNLWPSAPFAMHLHSLAWYGLLLAVAAALYRRFTDAPRVALLALLLYAIDDAHAPAVGWVANRNLILALALSLPALLLHDRSRRGGARRSAWLAPLPLLFGLCAGEGALVTVVYLVAYAVCLDRGSFTARLATLWPYATVVLAWRVLYDLLGYGARFSGLYVDPIASPLAFVLAVLERLPVLLLSQLALPWADFWELYPLTIPALRPIVFALALAVIAGFIALALPLLRASAHARFWALGGVLALLPACATFPHDRSLLGAGLGAMALVAALLRRLGDAAHPLWERSSIVALGGIHLVIAPLLLPVRAAHVADLNRPLNAGAGSLTAIAGLEQKSVVLLNPPIDPLAAYLPVYREASDQQRPKHLIWLATGVSELVLTSVDARTIRLQPRDGFLSSSSQLMLRERQRAPRLGERIELGIAELRVTRMTNDGRPLEIQVEFREPIRSEKLHWMRWSDQGYRPFTLPAEGSSTVFPAVDIASALSGRA